VPNIGPAEIRKRRVGGYGSFIVALAALIWLDASGISLWWRLGLFPLIWTGSLGVMQARARTCVALAARGVCNLDGTVRRVEDTGEAASLVASARRITWRATLLAIVLAALTLLLP
jgi:hypothetical protein